MKTNFYMTSPKFKLTELSILLNLYFLEVLEQVTTKKYLYQYSLRKGSFFRDLVRLKFRNFCVTRHLHGGQKSCHKKKLKK